MPAQPEPDAKLPVRRALGVAMLDFVQTIAEKHLDGEDEVMRQVATEKYRQAVMHAADQGVEVSLAWHTLGTWLEAGKDRIGAFSRALACLRAEMAAPLPDQRDDPWVNIHTEAECLYEIGRVHFHEDAPDAARKFLTEALPLAQKAELLRKSGVHIVDGLEGKIASLLIQL